MHINNLKQYYFIDKFDYSHLINLDKNISFIWRNKDKATLFKTLVELRDFCKINDRKFYVSNDPSGNDQVMREIVGNEDNTFTFDKKYNNIFCYGKEINDFHTLDKQKLFALNFSATQEIDKIQQAEKTKLAAAEAKIATLEARLSALENQ